MSEKVKVVSANYMTRGYVLAAWQAPDTNQSIAGWAIGVNGVGASLMNFDVQDGSSLYCGFPFQARTGVAYKVQITPYDGDGNLIDPLASDPFDVTVVHQPPG
ncbi:hypothetical protein WKR88_02455 [Trinickia caryophylli]|uniref:Uncharacterized protein n=1 Tax=Trinickia caryophylli TaxID=28094 RepID=A0A1X7DVY8_TRICW|nr:hypothetical protein [Trinickia caryophylli]TRX17965.1 hypothetical protein FNF07_06840 [Trinickia caryophylli]WQE11257.1 hypothetical protein U0034_16075 [Trinickia caryophylli]GLU32405.1 hypothetical protein Busp01_22470 [Trinickia caryophylli]SMF22514.1 hypothetical protein SAMN06295900_10494 [Trinickia caryophylli]